MEENTSTIFVLVLVFILGYLLGSIPWGLLIGKINGVDIRTKGSKNIGATNVTRVIGPGWGKICFMLDFLKGFLGVWLAARLAAHLGYHSPDLARIVGCAGALVGHIYPCWLKFKGGKGVATSAGGVFAMAIWPTVLGLLLWILIFLRTRIVAKASIAAAIAVPILALIFQLTGGEEIGWYVIVLIFVMAGVVIYRHKENIQRILAGKENAFK